jgi:hypothetical protein
VDYPSFFVEYFSSFGTSENFHFLRKSIAYYDDIFWRVLVFQNNSDRNLRKNTHTYFVCVFFEKSPTFSNESEKVFG